MAKWKYQKPVQKISENIYFRLGENKLTEITITNWQFPAKHPSRVLFSCDIVKANGLRVEKLWAVWNYAFKEELKKLLRGKNPNKDLVRLKVIKHVKDMDEQFEVSLLE